MGDFCDFLKELGWLWASRVVVLILVYVKIVDNLVIAFDRDKYIFVKFDVSSRRTNARERYQRKLRKRGSENKRRVSSDPYLVLGVPHSS